MTEQEMLDEQSRNTHNREFSETDVVIFMRDLSKCAEHPNEWLASNGCDELPDDIAMLLQSMALTCVAGHGGLQMPGSDRFWQVMKRMALDKFDFDRS